MIVERRHAWEGKDDRLKTPLRQADGSAHKDPIWQFEACVLRHLVNVFLFIMMVHTFCTSFEGWDKGLEERMGESTPRFEHFAVAAISGIVHADYAMPMTVEIFAHHIITLIMALLCSFYGWKRIMLLPLTYAEMGSLSWNLVIGWGYTLPFHIFYQSSNFLAPLFLLYIYPIWNTPINANLVIMYAAIMGLAYGRTMEFINIMRQMGEKKGEASYYTWGSRSVEI